MSMRTTSPGPGPPGRGTRTGDSWDAVLNNTHSKIMLSLPEQRKKTPAVATLGTSNKDVLTSFAPPPESKPASAGPADAIGSGVNNILSRIFGNGPPPKVAHGPAQPPADDAAVFKVPALPRKKQIMTQQSTGAKLLKTSSVTFLQAAGPAPVADPEDTAAMLAARPSGPPRAVRSDHVDDTPVGQDMHEFESNRFDPQLQDMRDNAPPPGDAEVTLPPERTLGNVLNRVSMIRGLQNRRKDGGLSAAEQRKALRQYWMPDSNSKDCYDCGKAFHTFRRRHHCRVCGQIFCWQCCTEVISGELLGYNLGVLRCCNYCKDVIRQSDEIEQPKSPDSPERGERPLSTLSEPSEDRDRGTNRQRTSTLMPRSNSAWNVARRTTNFNLDDAQLDNFVQSLARAVQDGSLKVAAHRDRLVTYSDCFIAGDFVDWILSTKKHCDERSQAVEIGQILLDRRFLVHVRGEEHIFRDDYILFKTTAAVLTASTPSNEQLTSLEEDPAWFEEITPDARMSPPLGSDDSRRASGDPPPLIDDKSRRGSVPQSPKDHPARESLFEDTFDSPDSPLRLPPRPVSNADLGSAIKSRASRGVRQTQSREELLPKGQDDDSDFRTATQVGQAHLTTFVEQLLVKSNLSLAWKGLLMKLLGDVMANVRPNLRTGDELDIRHYIKVKCITGGAAEDSKYFRGAILAKKIAHKKMADEIHKPRILLMQIALEYQRVENKYSSLETVLLQEEGYLKNMVAKIIALKPTVVVVGRSVARLAQRYIREAGITLVLNVKPAAMDYVARCTQGEVLKSINALNFVSKLGTCDVFRVRKYTDADGGIQSYVCFEGCAPDLGCTILLRGAEEIDELRRIQQVLQLGGYIANSIRLENHFLRNERAVNATVGEPIPLPLLGPHQHFEGLLRNTALSTSPGLVTPMPYLYTGAGMTCPVHSLLPRSVYWFSGMPETGAEQRLDCLSAENHQSLDVLFMCMDSNLYPCDPPRVIQMAFYGTNDVTLGTFLENYCLRPTYKCPNAQCDDSMESHIRTFVHNNGRVTISMERLKKPGPSELNNRRMCMWSWCKRCERSTAVVPVSDETWALSLGKFLETTFYGDGYRVQNSECTHSVHKDHIRYFNQGEDIVYFDYEPIEVSEVVVPSISLEVNELSSATDEWEQHAATCEDAVRIAVGEIKTQLSSIEGSESGDGRDSQVLSQVKKSLLDLELRRKYDERRLTAGVESFRASIASKAGAAMPAPPAAAQTSAGPAGEVHITDIEPADAVVLGAGITGDLEAELYSLQMEIVRTVHTWNETMPMYARKGSDKRSHQRTHSGAGSVKTRKLIDTGSKLRTDCGADDLSQTAQSSQNPAVPGGDALAAPLGLGEVETAISNGVDEPAAAAAAAGGAGGDTPKSPMTIVEAMGPSKEWKNWRQVALPSSTQWQPLKPPFSPTVHFCDPAAANSQQNIRIYEDEPSSIIAYLLAQESYRAFVDDTGSRTTSTGVGAANPAAAKVSADAGSDVPPAAAGTESSAGLATTKSGSSDKGVPAVPTNKKGKRSLAADAMAAAAAAAAAASESLAAQEAADRAEDESAANFKHQWSEGPTKFYCQIFFAKEFRDLRCLLHGKGEEGEDDFVRSLSRCVKWDPHGGKSKADFSKMLDDRYILKQMSRPEAQSSIEFIPHYIDYITKAHKQNKPTVFTKILGIYRIGYQNSQNRKAIKQDVLVMENLFYNHTVPRIFDLKGSMRSRYVQSTGKTGDVLLDENLVEFMCSSPLYVRDHCKHVLRDAIQNDTSFLADNGVMDYSLLLGIDEVKQELVVGVIDYIRTFTWDKRLEMYVKRTGILGGHGNLPTVISPKMYKQRFSEAMDRYFYLVPEKWSQLANFDRRAIAQSPPKVAEEEEEDDDERTTR